MKKYSFTLVELIVFACFLCILNAIAIPGFYEARKRALDKESGVTLGPKVSSFEIDEVDFSSEEVEAIITAAVNKNGIELGSIVGITKVGEYGKVKVFYIKMD